MGGGLMNSVGLMSSVVTDNTGSLIVLVVVGVLTYLVLAYRRPSRFPPGPPSVPILGSLPFLKHKINSFHREFARLGKIYGSVFSIAFGKTWIVVLNDYEAMREALVDKGVEFAGRIDDPRDHVVHRFLPIKGIIGGTYSQEWVNQRQTALHLLRNLGMGKRGIEERIIEERDTLLGAMAAKDGQAFDPGDMINTSVANVICALLFAEGFDHNDKDLKRLIDTLNYMMEAIGRGAEFDYIPLLALLPAYKRGIAEFKARVATLLDYIQGQIDARSDRNLDEPRDFIESYLKEVEAAKQNKSKITQNWMLDIAFDFFAAGAETTTTTLKWALLFMVRNPHVQEKVQEELDAVLGEPTGRGVSKLSDRYQLPYTQATIMEIQRRAAITATSLVHCTTSEVEFRGWRLPNKAQIRMNLYGVLNDPDYWGDPEVFRPERFLGKDGEVLKNERFIPFGMGRRMCLGEQLARQELFLFLSGILHTFKISLPEGAPEPSLESIDSLVLKCHPYKICLIPRL